MPRKAAAAGGRLHVRIAIAAAVLLTMCVAAVAAIDQPVTAASTSVTAGGQLIWAEPLRRLNAGQTRVTLHRAGFATTSATHGVTLYRLVYRTPAPSRRPTTASGLLAVPDPSTRVLTPVLFEHGTLSYRGDAPSSLPADLFASAPALSYAAAGYAAAAPDYLGLGVGPGSHPWFDVATETSASVDLLRAARSYLSSTAHRLGAGVLVTGFSQGASAALGVARALAEGVDRHFRLRAVAPVSGAYAFRRVELPGLLDGRVEPPDAVPYTAYLLTAWQRLHHLYREPGQVFREPYADRVDTLFGSEVPGPEMITALPRTIGRLLTPAGRALLAHPSPSFAAALRAADQVCDWRPRAPIRLYFADHDEQALTANTTVCARQLEARAAAPQTVDLGTPDYQGSRHLGSCVAAVTATVRWFARLQPPN